MAKKAPTKKKATKKTSKKKRPAKYESKLHIKASLDDVLNASLKGLK